MEIKQSNLFKQTYKKLHKSELAIVNDNIKLIMANPEIGELKLGDLSNIRVQKFKIKTHLYLLAYEYGNTGEVDLLYLMALGEHENFYEKLKGHLKGK